MTAGQRMELVKRMEIDNLEKKIPFEECVKIARELNLSVEQVSSKILILVIVQKHFRVEAYRWQQSYESSVFSFAFS